MNHKKNTFKYPAWNCKASVYRLDIKALNHKYIQAFLNDQLRINYYDLSM